MEGPKKSLEGLFIYPDAEMKHRRFRTARFDKKLFLGVCVEVMVDRFGDLVTDQECDWCICEIRGPRVAMGLSSKPRKVSWLETTWMRKKWMRKKQPCGPMWVSRGPPLEAVTSVMETTQRRGCGFRELFWTRFLFGKKKWSRVCS